MILICFDQELNKSATRLHNIAARPRSERFPRPAKGIRVKSQMAHLLERAPGNIPKLVWRITKNSLKIG
jgi:hypothetical protein